jgi:hypothetical protein
MSIGLHIHKAISLAVVPSSLRRGNNKSNFAGNAP